MLKLLRTNAKLDLLENTVATVRDESLSYYEISKGCYDHIAELALTVRTSTFHNRVNSMKARINGLSAEIHEICNQFDDREDGFDNIY